jgi:T-complex protein 1 subunit delta
MKRYILNICKKIKKCGANAVLIQKSILRDAYNKLSLHFWDTHDDGHQEDQH